MILFYFLTGIGVGIGMLWLGDWLPQRIRPAEKRTRYQTPIWLDGVIVVLLGGLFAYLGGRLGWSGETAVLALTATFFTLIAIIDLRYRLIFNAMVYPAILIALLFHIFVSGRSLLITLLGGLFAFIIFYLTFLLRPHDLGGGDVKLALLIGLILGFPTVLWALLVGVGSGAVTAVTLLLISRQQPKQHQWHRKSHIPYAPFLCFGAIVALLYNPIPLFLNL